MAVILISKEKFLEEHNKLSPAHLQATFALLTKFQQEKKPLLKDNGWSVDKLRIPFMSWLLSLPAEKKEIKETLRRGASTELSRMSSGPRQIYKNYPETH